MLYCSILLHVTFSSYAGRRLTSNSYLNFKIQVFLIVNYVCITVSLRVSTDTVIIRCFEIAVEIMRGFGLDSHGSGWGPVADSCEHGTELLGFTKCGTFLD
jgi:hypothetical protein